MTRDDAIPPTRLAPLAVVSREVLHQGFIRLERVTADTVLHGRTVRLTREVHHHGDGAAVLAYDPGRRVAVLVRQVRAAVTLAGADGFLLEAIAGLVDDGEDPAETVRREAVEEAGLVLSGVEAVGAPFSTPGTVTERVHLFLAEVDPTRARVGGGGVETEHEEIEVVEVPLATLADMADGGTLDDMKTLLLVETLRRRRPALFAAPAP
jgi:nudix-type nucleoside diphosphatase (YffH/AdpP family)